MDLSPDKGQLATGWQTIDGVQLCFDGSGKQKGERILIDGKYYYFCENSGELLRMHSILNLYSLLWQ
ncbi:MAG: hypothetical protein ACLVJN_07950 [Streptococcus parasanguinis]